MSDFKEFQGKSLDEAIETACDFYNLERGKLEIEIISGGSTGIFGLMGVKKAVVKARPRPGLKPAFDEQNAPGESDEAQEYAAAADETDEDFDSEYDDEDEDSDEEYDEDEYDDEDDDEDIDDAIDNGEDEEIDEEILEAERDYERARLARQQGSGNNDNRRPAPPKGNRPDGNRNGNRNNNRYESRPNRNNERRYERKPQQQQPSAAPAAPEVYDGPDPILVEETVREVLTHLLQPITGQEPELSFTREAGRFDVFIDDDENSGLIIGREGQTLSALQYLTNRIVSRKLEAPVRIQIDTGDYRERQNESLRRLALQLADKAKNIGRTQSTRPLSSYHRRVVHMALQNDSGIQTRSKGDGPLKKVLILPNRRRNGGGGGGGGRSHQRNTGGNREYQHRDRW